MPLAPDLALDDLTPARLWSALDPETRKLAAEALYDPAWDDDGSRVQANLSIAATLRYREASVKKLPTAKRVDYLVRIVRPSEQLSGSLLTALHLGHRAALLSAFLDALGIPQKDGVIEAEHQLQAPTPDKLNGAVAALSGKFPDEQVELYLACLLAIDSGTWGGLAEPLGALRSARGSGA